jgi:Large polyvalent protein associated domain 38
MSVSFDDLFDEPAKPSGKAAPKNAAISFDDLFEKPAKQQSESLGDVRPKARAPRGGQPMSVERKPEPLQVGSGNFGAIVSGILNSFIPDEQRGVIKRTALNAQESFENTPSAIKAAVASGGLKMLPESKSPAINQLTGRALAGEVLGDSFAEQGARNARYDQLREQQAPKSAAERAFEQKLQADQTALGTIGTLASDPIRGAGLIAESLGASAPAIGISMLLRNPSALAAVNSASGFQQELSYGMIDYLEGNQIPMEQWADLPEDVMMKAVNHAQKRAVVVAASGMSGQLAGTQLVGRALANTPAKAVVANSLAQAGAQGLVDASGEDIAQRLGDLPYSAQSTVLEGIGGLASAPAEALQTTLEAARLAGSKFDQKGNIVPPKAEPAQTEMPTPEDLGNIGVAIEAEANKAVQAQEQATRTMSEAGSVIDKTLSELEAATKPRLDKAEAKALQAELQDINAVLKEQEGFERDGVIRAPENNLSADDKQGLAQRQIEIKSKLEAHRAAGSAESRLRELESKLSKIDNDNDLLALANGLSPFVSQNKPAEQLGTMSAEQPASAASPSIEGVPLEQVITELGSILTPETPEGDVGLSELLAGIQEKPASPDANSAPLSAKDAKAGLASGTMGNDNQIASGNTQGQNAGGSGSGTSSVQWSATQQQSDSPAARAGFKSGQPTVSTVASKYAERVFAEHGFKNASVREVPESSMPVATVRVKKAHEKLTGNRVVVFENQGVDILPNGFYDPQSKTIFVSNESETIVSRVMSHEFFHWLETEHPQKVAKLKAIVAKNGNVAGHSASRSYDKYSGYSFDLGVSELSADLTGDAMNDIGFLRKVAKEDPTFWRDILNDFIEFIDSMLSRFGKQNDLDSAKYITEAKAFRDELQSVLVSLGKEKSGKMPANTGAQNVQPTAAAESQGLPLSSRVRGSDGVLAEPRRPYQGDGRKGKSLEGFPTKIRVDDQVIEFAAFKPAQDAAERYMEQAGLDYDPPTTYVKVDPARAKAIADEFEAMAHTPEDPEVQRAYSAMIAETLAQYQTILDTGLKVEFITGADPYGNPRNAILDIVENNHFWVYSTKSGFGSNEEFDPLDNPLLQETEFQISGQPALANDIFRVVHDYFGHVKEGVGFRADGEENAWRSHSAMFSPLARKAMTTETRGQNSWVNYGKYGETNRTASPSKTIYADQKIGLLPDWVVNDGVKFSRKKGTMADGQKTTKANSDEQSGIRPAPAPVSERSAGARVSTQKSPDWLPLPEIKTPANIPAFGKAGDNSVSAYGVHYSGASGLTALDGKYAGSGSSGAERRRFGIGNYGAQAKAGDTARRLYFYAQAGQTPPVKESVVTGDNRYMVRLDNLYDVETDPLDIASNNRRNPDMFEEELVEAGFDGAIYDTRESSGITEPTVVLFGLKNKVPVVAFSRRKIESSKDWTFSPLARMVEGAPLKQVSTDQWQKWIAANANKTGVKSDELEYSGISEWLALQNGKVSKEDIAAYLDAGGVQVTEVQKSMLSEDYIASEIEIYVGDEASGYENGQVEYNPDGTMNVYDDNGVAYENLKPSILAEELGLEIDDFEDSTKFNNDDYRVAGGENYRETLMTLPKKRVSENEAREVLGAKPDAKLTDADIEYASNKKQGSFQSRHWNEPNVLAHIRHGEHTDAEGNRVLFVYEIQSDWAQKGRKDGFAVTKIRKEFRDDLWRVVNQDGRESIVRDEREADKLISLFSKEGVPLAPFVTDTKAWVGLAIKRVIRMAVDEGFDKVVFVNGQQAADYFDLSKSVSRISWDFRHKHSDEKLVAISHDTGEYYIYIDKGGKVIAAKGNESFVGKTLDEIIGKDIAKKIVAEETGELTGDGLKIGGEGMKAFYDKLVPQVANDVLKKIGGGKVEPIEFSAAPEGISGRDAMNIMGVPEDEQDTRWVNMSAQERDNFMRTARFKKSQTKQLGFTITPAMKQKVSAGEVPLFSRRYTSTAGWDYDTSSWEGFEGQLKKSRQALQDKMLAWRDVQSAIEKGTGSPVPDAQNVYRLENLMHGRVSEKIKDLEAKHYVPISKMINRFGIKTEDLQEYLIARHAPERNARIASINPKMQDGGSGMLTADANAYIAAIPAKEKANLDAVAAKIDALIKDTLKRQFDSGLIDSATYSTLTSMYKHYVPLRGTDDEFASAGTGTGQGLDSRGKVIKSALGRGEGNEAANVLGEVIGDSLRSVITSEKARVGRSLMRLILANPSKLWSVEPVQTMRYLDSNGEVAEKIVQDWNDDSIIGVKHAGKTYKVQVNDPRLIEALKNLGDAHLNGFLTATAKVNRYFSAVLTQYNPAFIPVNASRDMIFGLTGLAAEHGALTAAKAAANYPEAALAAWNLARGKSGSSAVDVYAKEFADAGGKTGFVHMESVEDLQNKLGSGKFGSYDPKGLMAAGRAIADTVSHINDGVENALRLSAYITLRKDGMAAEKAAEYAKNLTVNFNRKGTNGTQINAVLLFFNASIQGAARSLKLMKNPKVYAYLGTMAAIQAVAALAAMGMKEDDEEDSLWDKIPDHVKRRNIVIPIDASHYITIPMPYGMNVFTYSTSKIMDAVTNKGQRPEESFLTAAADVMNAAVESFSPIPLSDGVWGIVPQILTPAVNIARNRDGLDRTIRSEKPYDRADMPLAGMGKPDTMEIFKVTAKALNRLGGGDDYTPPAIGFLDRAPEDIEYLLKELSGGAGKFVIDVATLGEKAYSDADVSLRDIPISKRFVTSVDDVATQQAMYYQRTQSIARSVNKMQDIYIAEGKDAAVEFIEKTPELSGVIIKGKTETGRARLKARSGSLYDVYKETEDAIDERNDAFRSAYNSAPARLFPNKDTVARDKAVKELNMARAEQQKLFNKAWHRDVVSIAE